MTTRAVSKEPETDNPCAGTLPMAEWVEIPDDPDGACKPCILPVGAARYAEELKERGQDALAAQIERLADDPSTTPLTLAQTLDRIKGDVTPEIGTRLREFDCHIQVNAKNLSEEE